MTPLDLQGQLKEEMEKILKNISFTDITGKEKAMTVYEQFLPVKQNDDDDGPFPYCIVRLENGIYSDSFDETESNFMIIMGIQDFSADNSGYKRLMVAIDRFMERFFKDSRLQNFWRKGEVEWAITSDEEYYPYFFAGIKVTFQHAGIIRRETE